MKRRPPAMRSPMIWRGISLRRSVSRSTREYEHESESESESESKPKPKPKTKPKPKPKPGHLSYSARDQLPLFGTGTAVASGAAPDTTVFAMADLYFTYHQYFADAEERRYVRRQFRQCVAIAFTGSGSQ